MSFSSSWGGVVDSTAMYTSDEAYIYYPGAAVPTGRLAANGRYPIRIDSVGIASLSNGYGRINYRGVLTTGGTVFGDSGGSGTAYAWRTGGTMYVGRDRSGSGSTYWASGSSLTGSMPGTIYYSTVPSAARSLALNTSIPGRLRLTWSNPSVDGQSPITGYMLQRATNAAFTTGVVSTQLGNVLTYDDTTAEPGVVYYYRVFAKNAVSTAAGTYAVASATVSGSWNSGLRFDDGAAFQFPVWSFDNGAAWVPVTSWWYDNGTAWVLVS